jgi:hypothetical protein
MMDVTSEIWIKWLWLILIYASTGRVRGKLHKPPSYVLLGLELFMSPVLFCHITSTFSVRNINICNQGFFSGKRGARTHKRGKDKHTESFVTISLSCSPTS